MGASPRQGANSELLQCEKSLAHERPDTYLVHRSTAAPVADCFLDVSSLNLAVPLGTALFFARAPRARGPQPSFSAPSRAAMAAAARVSVWRSASKRGSFSIRASSMYSERTISTCTACTPSRGRP